MKVYLLHPPFVANGKELPKFFRCVRWQGCASLGGTYWYPIWLSYATGAVEGLGHKAKLVDAPAKDWGITSVKRDVHSFKPDIVVIESNFSSTKNDLGIFKALKEDIDFVSVLVGPPASQFHEEIIQNAYVDVVGRYEYDLTVSDIAQALEKGTDFEHVAGITYTLNGRTMRNPDRPFMQSADLDRIPFVTSVYKRHLDVRDYVLSHALFPMVQLFTSRGCPNQCTFCSWPKTLMGTKYRTRSVTNVVDEFEYVADQLPAVKELFIEDDTYTINKKRVQAICNEIKTRGIDVRWSCNARANLDYETMQIMKSAGCRLLDVGYESGSDEILKTIKKGITIKNSKTFASDAKRAGLKVLADFIFGLPGESHETIQQSMRLIKETKPDLLQIAIATPIPGTEFCEWVSANGYLVESDPSKTIDENGLPRCVISYPNLSSKQLVESVEAALKDYYFSASFARIAARNILREDGWHELTVLVKSARVFLKHVNRSS